MSTEEWVRERIKFFSAKKICQLADINYDRLKNWKMGRVKLSIAEAERIKEAMKKIVE